jgi:hypothetical protein
MTTEVKIYKTLGSTPAVYAEVLDSDATQYEFG